MRIHTTDDDGNDFVLRDGISSASHAIPYDAGPHFLDYSEPLSLSLILFLFLFMYHHFVAGVV